MIKLRGESLGTAIALAGLGLSVLGLGAGVGEVLTVPEIRRAGERLVPLHEGKRPPQPGDWLDQHKERGQSFDMYLRSEPNRPTRVRTTIYIQPIGEFDPAEARLIDATRELLAIVFNVPVKTLAPLPLDTIPERARRVHPEWNVPQILTGHVLNLLKTRRPPDAVAVLALTRSDLWPGRGWNFVFGEASLGERVGVWSIHRLGDPQRDAQRCLRRTLQVATHETGHMFGIPHCTAFECGMNGSNHLVESDSQPLWFCPQDEMKIWWACGADPKARFEKLVAFARAHGLETEARFWERSKASLDSDREPGSP